MRIALFGDAYGIPISLRYLNPTYLVCIVGAADRGKDHYELKVLANFRQVPFLIQPAKNSKDYSIFLVELEKLNVDLIIINSYSMKLQAEILSLSKHGAVNIHASLLPRNRGPNPLQWALINSDSSFGVTLHEATETLDAGPIIDQIEIPINFEDSWITLRAKSTEAIKVILLKNIKNLENGNWISSKQNLNNTNMNLRRVPDDSEFAWSDSLISIYNKIRALLPPMPSAYAKNRDGTKDIFYQIPSLMKLITMKSARHECGYLSGEKVKLRPPAKSDYSILSEWSNDSENVILNSSTWGISELDNHKMVGNIVREFNDQAIFVIERAETGTTVGYCQLICINWQHKSAELQISYVGKEAWTREQYISVIQIICDFVKFDLNLTKVYFYVHDSDRETVKIYEELGFKIEKFMNSFYLKIDESTNYRIMSVQIEDLPS
jgi:methionyl-tRNA formyltransferase